MTTSKKGVLDWLGRHLEGDRVVWGVMLLLSILSILTVYSAVSSLAYRQMRGDTEHYLIKHSSLVLLSLATAWAAHRINYRYYAGLSTVGLWMSVPLLLLAWRYGVTLNEASRWLTIPLINKTFQPSDLAQLSLVAFLAHRLARHQHAIESFEKAVVPMLVWCSVISGLIALTNLSGAVLLFLTCMVLMYIGRVRSVHLLTLLVVGGIAGLLSLSAGQRRLTAASRIRHFTQKEVPFQARQAYMAIASGGLYGKGPGNSQQRHFLPHSHADFIYAILIEEYGLLGGIAVLMLYLLLFYRSVYTAQRTQNVYGALLSAGLGLLLTLQAMVNMAVAVGLGPVTGLTLPFVSMGGTSLVFTGIALGIILSVSRHLGPAPRFTRSLPSTGRRRVLKNI